jgi:hypothetical protein
MLWFFFLFIWLVILFHILTDLFRDHTLSGGMKTLWVRPSSCWMPARSTRPSSTA